MFCLLHCRWSLIWRYVHLPLERTCCRIVPNLKKDDTARICSYYPISLICNFARGKSQIPNQHGFVKRPSTVSNIGFTCGHWSSVSLGWTRVTWFNPSFKYIKWYLCNRINDVFITGTNRMSLFLRRAFLRVRGPLLFIIFINGL